MTSRAYWTIKTVCEGATPPSPARADKQSRQIMPTEHMGESKKLDLTAEEALALLDLCLTSPSTFDHGCAELVRKLAAYGLEISPRKEDGSDPNAQQ